MNLPENFNSNTILHFMEENVVHYDSDDNRVIDIYEMSFGFYDCHYNVYVRSKNIESNNPSVELDGDSKLYSSFEELCENEMWDFIKAKCIEFNSLAKQF